MMKIYQFLIALVLFTFFSGCVSNTPLNEAPKYVHSVIDSTRGKWGDYQEPAWLRYFGFDCGDLNGNGLLDLVAGRYVYLNPGGSMSGLWKRFDLGRNVDGLLITNVNDNNLPDIIAVALPEVYWIEAFDSGLTEWNYTIIGKIPATGHVNGQGYAMAEIINGGKPEVLITGNGGVFCAEIPENPNSDWGFKLIAASRSDEGIGIGDMDGDGRNDILFTFSDGDGEKASELALYLNPGNIDTPWDKMIIGRTDGNPIDRIAVADLNGDGKPDVAVTEERWPGLEPDARLWWFEHPGDLATGKWERHLLITQYSMNNLGVGDVTGNGFPDIVTNEHKGDTLKLQLFMNDGKGNFKEILLDQGKEMHLGARLFDLNGDGRPEILGAAWDNYRFLHLWKAPE